MAFEPDLKNQIFPGTIFKCTKFKCVTNTFEVGKYYKFKRFKTEWGKPEWWFEVLFADKKSNDWYNKVCYSIEEIKECLIEVPKDELVGILYGD